MSNLEKYLKMLQSEKASVRYEACEELRVATESSPEIVLALEQAKNDEDAEVVERAKAALDADVHQQMALKIGKTELLKQHGSKVATYHPTIDEQMLQQDVIASTGQRLGNLFLDSIFCYAFGILFVIVLALIGLREIIVGIDDTFLWVIIVLLYYVPQEAFSGRTLGKLITGTKAVNIDGTELTFGKALGRTFCRFIPFEAFSFLGGEGRPEGWHDRIPMTMVISIRKK